MKQQIKIINVDTSDALVGTMKLCVASAMTEWEQNLLEQELPKREDYESNEEYEQDRKQLMIDLVDEVQKLKKQVFVSVLDSYNDLLSAKYEIENNVRESNQSCIDLINQSRRDIKNAGIVTLLLTIVFPQSLPFLLILNIPRVGLDVLATKASIRRINLNQLALENIKGIQYPMYDLTCDLRSDYHESNRRLKELRDKAVNGENIIGDLLELVNPERVHLKRVEKQELLFLGLEEKEKPNQFIKKDNQ